MNSDRKTKVSRNRRAKALQALGLHPEAAMGPGLESKVDDLFSKADRVAAAALASGNEPARYVALVHAAGDALATLEEQKAVVAPKLSSLLAHFLRAAARFCTGPDRVVFDPGAERIQLFLRERPLLTIEPLQVVEVGEQLLKEAEGAFRPVSARRSEQFRADPLYFREQVKCLAGLTELGSNIKDDFLEQFPSVERWLHAGKQLCGCLGGSADDLELVKKVAAIALDVPSLELENLSNLQLAQACGPWYLKSSDPLADVCALYSSPIHATAALIKALAERRFATGNAPYMRIGCEGSNLSSIWVRNRRPERDEAGMAWWSLPGCEIAPCDTAESTPGWEAFAERLLNADTSKAIENGFRAGQSRTERNAWHDEYHDERLLVESAEWRFTVSPASKPKYLTARMLDVTGRAIFEAEVHLRGRSLAYAPELDAHVLRCSSTRQLVAIMRGLQPTEIKVLQRAVGRGDRPCPFTELAGLDDYDVSEIGAFMDRVQRTQM